MVRVRVRVSASGRVGVRKTVIVRGYWLGVRGRVTVRVRVSLGFG